MLFHEDSESELVRNFEIDDLSAGIFQSLRTPQSLENIFSDSLSWHVDREEFDCFIQQAIDKGVVLRYQPEESADLGEFGGRLKERFVVSEVS